MLDIPILDDHPPEKHPVLELPELLGQILEYLLVAAAESGEYFEYADFRSLALVSICFARETRRLQRQYAPTWVELLDDKLAHDESDPSREPAMRLSRYTGDLDSFNGEAFLEVDWQNIRYLPRQGKGPNSIGKIRLRRLLHEMLLYKYTDELFPNLEVLDANRLPYHEEARSQDYLVSTVRTLILKECLQSTEGGRSCEFDSMLFVQRLAADDIALQHLEIDLYANDPIFIFTYNYNKSNDALLPKLFCNRSASFTLRSIKLSGNLDSCSFASLLNHMSKFPLLASLSLKLKIWGNSNLCSSKKIFHSLKTLELDCGSMNCQVVTALATKRLEKLVLYVENYHGPSNYKILSSIRELVAHHELAKLRSLSLLTGSTTRADLRYSHCEWQCETFRQQKYLDKPLPRARSILEHLVGGGASNLEYIELDIPSWYGTSRMFAAGEDGHLVKVSQPRGSSSPDLERQSVHILRKFLKLVTLIFATCECRQHASEKRPRHRMLRRKDLINLAMEDFDVDGFCDREKIL